MSVLPLADPTTATGPANGFSEHTYLARHVAVNSLTDYFNKANNTDVDSPLVEVRSHE